VILIVLTGVARIGAVLGPPAGPLDWPDVSLTLGIVGLPNVGKSTVFNALTRAEVLAANYPFATIEPNVGVVPLPDPRLDRLAEMFSSTKIVPATVSFVDIAGIVKGASEGAGLGNKFLANIREADAICQVVRVFADDDVVHVDGRVDPLADIETINTELILADLQTLEKAVPRLEKEARNARDRASVAEAAKQAVTVLDAGRTLFSARAEIELPLLRELSLMTAKPFLYVFNADESVLTDSDRRAELAAAVAPADAVFLDAKVESELLELDEESAAELLESIGQPEPGLHALARAGFHTLGLQTYLTAGPKESRAWTIHAGDTAPKAAGVIHTDFERGFIRAETVSYDDFMANDGWKGAREKGVVRSEGKEYVVKDGDVMLFRFNV
jgi:GTP-binding protein YchF